MKKLFAILSLVTTPAFAQSNYFAIVSSNTYIHGISKQYIEKAFYTETTNTSIFGFSGYMYPSNFNGTTKWSFPARIMINTNALLSFNVLTTNTATAVGGTYRLQFYTNGNLVVPAYDSTDTIWLGVIASYNTNLQTVMLTNTIPTNMVNNTNINLCTFGVKIGPVAGAWYTSWITGGEIKF